MAFEQADFIPNTSISQTIIQNARTAWSQGNYAGAWQILADAGDRYADNAASVIGGNTPSGQFFHELVKKHWENTVGIDVYNNQFKNVARDHLNNYLTQLENGYIPSTQDILNSYQDALQQKNIPTIAAFDVAWAKAMPGTSDLGDSGWAVLLGIDASRITTSSTDNGTPAVVAESLITFDFAQTFYALGLGGSLAAMIDLETNYYGALWDYVKDLLGGVLNFVITPAYSDTSISEKTFVLGGKDSDILNGSANTDFIYGDAGNDTLNGNGGNDYLEGGLGNDILNGGEGNDTLQGGNGTDTYQFTGNYGIDVISDSDGLGSIQIDGQVLTNATQQVENIYKNSTGYTFIKVNDGSLIISKAGDANRIVIKDWSDTHNLGINLQLSPTSPTTTLTGDFKKKIDTHDTPDNTSDDTYVMTNGNYTPDTTAANGEAGALDLISGTAGSDVIDGKAGSDWLSGKAGDDYITGGSEGDYIQGGLGKDTLVGGDGDDYIYGSSDEDINKPTDVNFPKPTNPYIHPQATGFNWFSGYNATLENGVPDGYTNPGHDRNRLANDDGNIIDGGAGNDFIAAGTGNDYVSGGADNDEIWGMDKDDILLGYGGNDLIYGDGDNGNDTNSVIWTLPKNHGNDIIDGGDGDDILYGQGGDDLILGGIGNDKIWGDDSESNLAIAYHGNDTLSGGAGDDFLLGNGGNDTLDGGAGIDELQGGSGNDLLISGGTTLGEGDMFGGAGDDTLIGGDGADYFDGGSGDDIYRDVGSEDRIVDRNGNDTILSGASGLSTTQALTLAGTTGLTVTLDTGNTLNLLDVFFGSHFTLQFNNGTQIDLESFIGNTFTTAVSLQMDNLGGYLYGGAAGDTLYGGTSNDTLNGYLGDDILAGGLGNNVLDGGVGDDTLYGNGLGGVSGNNILKGGAGYDTLYGAKGNDILDGGNDDDYLAGGAGDDSYYVDHILDNVSENSDAGFDTIYATLSLQVLPYY